MEITGTVHEVGDVQNVTETFKKRELIVEYVENPEYPEFLKFEVIQDKVGILDSLRIGMEVKISFNLRGRAYTDKAGKKGYFNSLQAWKLDFERAKDADPKPKTQPKADLNSNAEDDDDLPF